MGYNTRYKLTWEPIETSYTTCPHCQGTGKITVGDRVKAAIETEKDADGFPISTNLDDSVKWYTHETDMLRLSLKFPDVLFTLRGEGEESGDVWVKYFKGGKMQVEKLAVKLPDFDPSKLK